MYEINITELRNHLPQYLSNVTMGAEIIVTSHGKPIAHIIPPIDRQKDAQEQLKKLRQICKVGDVESPIKDDWEVEK